MGNPILQNTLIRAPDDLLFLINASGGVACATTYLTSILNERS